MHRLAVALTVVLAASCASQTRPRTLNVQVFEQQSRTSLREAIQGQHAFVVRMQNISEETVSIDEISLNAPSPVIEFHDADQAIDRVLEPGEAADFTMWVEVTTRQYVNSLDTLDVTLACHSSARGNFTESGSHTIAVLR